MSCATQRDGVEIADMKPCRIAVFGQSFSEQGATWRSLLRAMHARGHDIMFFDRVSPSHAMSSVFAGADWLRLVVYDSLTELSDHADEICRADVLIISSGVPEAMLLTERLRSSAPGLLALYDMDTPITAAAMERGDCAYLDASTARLYDLALCATGGPFLELHAIATRLIMARPLFCSADPEQHVAPNAAKRWDLSYLGDYSEDRQSGVEQLFLSVARALPDRRFAIAGAQYPDGIDWPENVERIEHMPPGEHASFYSASRFTLSVTRQEMRAAGYSPSVRLFEAAACATPIISDEWRGLDEIFAVGREIFVARRADDVIEFVTRTSDPARDALGTAARARVLGSHTGAHRAEELEAHLADALKMRERTGRSNHQV